MKKTIVITGATGVLGSLAAKTFAERGDNLVLLDRNQARLDSLSAELNLPSNRLHTQVIDLLDAQALQDSAEAVHSKFGSVHGLIHLIGGWVGGKTIPESSKEDFDFMLNQHVWTTFNLFRSYAPHIAPAAGDGSSLSHNLSQ
ncbi:MAG: SDR family oxidoreductase [Anaerolineales bacterium]|nr:SDR family oxidoreductase [Anaerolineales bacterium]